VTSRLTAPAELDLATTPTFEAEIADAISASDADLLIDFSSLTFIDSTGVRALVSARAVLNAQGRTLFVTNADTKARRIFEITNFADLLADDC
jgi:anti-sigma B factor antagonist